jgi:hypothetical protein
VVGVVDGGAYGHCFFVGGIEVSILTCLSWHAPRETLDLIIQIGRWCGYSALLSLLGNRFGAGYRSERHVVWECVCRYLGVACRCLAFRPVSV